MDGRRFLVTGAAGCIGSWVLRLLLSRGETVVAADPDTRKTRPRLLIAPDELEAVPWLALDVTDGAAVAAAVAEQGITHIIHLAGLQVPFCKADPPLGAAVNVTGTVNIFEAARANRVAGLAYASSLAVLGPAPLYDKCPVPDDAMRAPETIYGVYKVANEDCARIYWQDWQQGSVGLRPAVVYGVGRDQGLTSDIAKAVLACAAGRPFRIRFDGPVTLQHAGDVAEMFIGAAMAEHGGAAVCNIRNDVVTVAELATLLSRLFPGHRISHADGAPLPVPADLDDAALRGILGTVPHTPLETAITRDYAMYRRLIAQDRIDLSQLEG